VGNSGKRASYLCEKKLSINQIHESWQPLLSGEFKKEYFQELTHFVEHEYKMRFVSRLTGSFIMRLTVVIFKMSK
jgi:uracil DNA glycosylase